MKTLPVYWYQNIQQSYAEPLNLTASYDPLFYYTYNNYEAIEVSKVKDIPKDYFGIMGVPLTFYKRFNPQQFEVVGSPHANVLPDGWRGMTKEFLDLYYAQGNTAIYNEGNRLPYYITKDGKATCPYQRLLIRRKQ